MKIRRSTLATRLLIAAAGVLALALPVMPAFGQSYGSGQSTGQGAAPTGQSTGQSAAPTGQSGGPSTAGSSMAAAAAAGVVSVKQTSNIQMSVDSPLDGTDVSLNQTVIIGGWAVDPTQTGTGVDKVVIYLDGSMDTGTLLGNAKYGSARADVATLTGNQADANSGFNYKWSPTGIGSGPHQLFIYAHSTADNWYYTTVTVNGPAGVPNPTRTPPPNNGYNGPNNGYNGPNNGYNGPNNGQYMGPNNGYPQGGYGPYMGPVTPYGGTYLNNSMSSPYFGLMSGAQGPFGNGSQYGPPGAGCGPNGPLPGTGFPPPVCGPTGF